MRKRNKQIILRLNEKEYAQLMIRVKKSGLTRQSYIISIINGYIPTDLPPPDYHLMANELRAIGNCFNQIAQKAHVLGVIDTQKYDEAFSKFKEMLIKIVEAVNLPRKIEYMPVDQNNQKLKL